MYNSRASFFGGDAATEESGSAARSTSQEPTAAPASVRSVHRRLAWARRMPLSSRVDAHFGHLDRDALQPEGGRHQVRQGPMLKFPS